MKTICSYKFQKNFNLQKVLTDKESALIFKKEIFDLISTYKAKLLHTSSYSEDCYQKLPSQAENLNNTIVDIILNTTLVENGYNDIYNHLIYSISSITNDKGIITTARNFGKRQYVKIEMEYLKK